ncbi:restriction endonuclease fold toxin 5 domain-containing protein [Stigmatella erecta]|uniref:Restriction endonuclease fold toxin 5 n=1 Tax=Stigmatella erecta TaxID=83460 RepID=A0A1I0L471_9BACT|nr:restriction endonuclease fold toxin 5 domain-containing protein [Stigmatella erecta]SEU34109.1 Restriction endonuclease fold toxin 5 [Stigmatella erecta]
MPRQAVLVLCVFFVACSATTKAVHLDTGPDKRIIHVPRLGVDPVKVSLATFQETVAKHGRRIAPAERPLPFARHLFGMSERGGWYHYERRSRRLFPLGAENELQVELSPASAALNRQYGLWCSRAWGPPSRDCLRLLVDSPVLDGDGKYALAMAIAQGAVLGEMKNAFRHMANPEAVLTTLTGAMTMYLMLWLLPEPISKGVAALMTVGLVSYLGWELVWKLIAGWRELAERVEQATTFEEIRAAGETFAQVMGDKGAKALVMMTAVAVGNTAAGMAAKMPGLPGAGQAALLAESQLNIRFSAAALAQVESVALHAEGVIVSLAPTAVAMTAGGSPGETTQPPPSGGPGEWVRVAEHMSESARNYQAQVTGAPKGHVYRVQRGDEAVDFDGFAQGALLEVKGTGYAQWVDHKLSFFKMFEGGPKMLDQARRQFRAARGTPVRWIVAEEKLVGVLRKMFADAGLPIEVIHVLPAP